MVDQRQLGGLSLLLWILASVVGWTLSPILLFYGISILAEFMPLLSDASYIFAMVIGGILLGPLLGMTFGVLQWLVLRKHITQAYWWIAINIVGISLGVAIGMVTIMHFVTPSVIYSWPFFIPASLAAGITVGSFQRLVLRRHFSHTWWWIVPSALSWPMSLIYLLGALSDGPVWKALVVPPVLGLITGVMSGVALLFISRRSKKESR